MSESRVRARVRSLSVACYCQRCDLLVGLEELRVLEVTERAGCSHTAMGVVTCY